MRQTFRLLLKVCLGYALVLWACIQLFPGAFARIFTPEPELVAFTAGMLRIYCGALFLMGIQIACQMTFVSIGNAPCSIVVAVLRKFVLLLPLIYLLPHLLADQTRAVFLAEPWPTPSPSPARCSCSASSSARPCAGWKATTNRNIKSEYCGLYTKKHPRQKPEMPATSSFFLSVGT